MSQGLVKDFSRKRDKWIDGIIFDDPWGIHRKAGEVSGQVLEGVARLCRSGTLTLLGR